VPQRWGIDTAALRVKSSSGGNEPPEHPTEEQVIADAKDHVRLFDKETVQFLRRGELPDGTFDRMPCNCPACEGKTIEASIKRFVTDEGGVDEQNIRDFVRLHNANMSNGEFEVSRKMCKSQELKHYFETKAGLMHFATAGL
jgi:hypothetical protein